ncbi:hypothetical protein AA0112_g4446 [Alternaria arborescens]|nr:hypothetical protein AA0112_g4446 [Alternaria arborescens]
MYADVVTGILTSEPSFEPSVKATAIRGGDWISTAPPNPNSNATVLRLHVDVLVKVDGNAEEDAYIRMRCTGAEIATPEVAAIVSGNRDASPVKFGDFQATSSWTFETASKNYWELQNAVFVGSTSLRVGEDEGTLVASERSVSFPESPLVNISSLNTADQDTYPADITITSDTDSERLVHTSATKDADWDKSVCRGRKLVVAMTRDASQGTRYINPLFTQWDGDLEKEMVDRGWDNWQEHRGWCDFKDNGLSPALKALGIGYQHVDDKVDNQCWVANHSDGPGVLFNPDDPDDIDDSDDEMPAMDDQYYMDPNGQRKRSFSKSIN